MSMYNLLKTFFIMFIFGLLLIGCDNDVPNIGNNNINNQDVNTDDNGNTGDEIIENDKINSLKGTIWYADGGSLFIEFPDNHLNLILFRNYQNYGSIGGNLNGNVTLGNFRLSSYDGETMKLLDYDNLEVAFSVIISENKMTVDGLNAIKWTAPPFERRDFRNYNQTYTKGE
ncbi:hypothetical protein FACS1894130_12490 [Spirochaetia bacterium]|nr:hypothetical protein FACS1894130_12490 [Spirochaetia bacterium]